MVVIGHVVWSIMGDQGFIIIFSLNGLILEDWKKKALLYILLQFIHKIIFHYVTLIKCTILAYIANSKFW